MLDQPPFATASTLTTNPQQVLTLEDGFPAHSANTIHNTYAADSNFRRPYAQTWNFSMEDEIVRNVILSVGYVGTKGTKLDLLLSPDSVNPSASGSQQTSIPGVQQFLYETSGAASIYNGAPGHLAAAVPRRLFHERLSTPGANRLTTRPAWEAMGTTCRRTALICRRNAPFPTSTFATS